jgi:LmbE family N-acetylglucosaminyl deacetylase
MSAATAASGRPVIDLAADGPSEAAWTDVGAALPTWSLESLHLQRLVVVAPHPDDESLGIGGTIAMLARRVPVTVVCVTDGEAAPAVGYGDDLAVTRRAEMVEAIETLAPGADIVRLGAPDGAVAAEVTSLTEGLAALIDAGDLVLSTLDGDGHPDHDAVGAAARSAAERRGATHLWFPVWAWHWHDPQSSIIRHRGLRVDIDEAAQEAKAAAVARYASQLGGPEPVVPADHVRRCLRTFEVVIPS